MLIDRLGRFDPKRIQELSLVVVDFEDLAGWCVGGAVDGASPFPLLSRRTAVPVRTSDARDRL
jgi:ribosomal protein S16